MLLLIGEAAAVARYGGAGWPAVWTLALSLAFGVALAGALVFRGDRQLVLAGVATAALAADAAAVTVWAGGATADAGLAVAVTGALVVMATCQTVVAWPGPQRVSVVVGQVGGIATAVGVLLSVVDADRLWLALLAAGVAAGVAALRGIERNKLGWVSGGLLAASTWVRLALSDVDAPEPYTAPAGIALLVVGYLRRRRDPSYRSWPAYAPGLALVLVPSLLRAVDDPGLWRPLLLGLTALAVLVVGVMRRLQAPLVIGGTVLAVDALVQLSPYLADLYDAVPRWTWIGASGLLLLVLGATYERRVRELRAAPAANLGVRVTGRRARITQSGRTTTYDAGMTRVLLAEDDQAISEPLARALRREGYDVEVCEDGPGALESATGTPCDLVVLDLGLPGMDGLEVCRRLRNEGSGVPVLVLTARTDEVDTVVGLDAGADDYVTKPFRLAELLARVRALLRRGTVEPVDDVHGVRIDVDSHRVWMDDRELTLTAKEFDLLRVLLRDAGKVVTREQLMREVWDTAWWGSTKTLDMHVSWLRKKLGDDAANPRYITTVRGVGFRFERE